MKVGPRGREFSVYRIHLKVDASGNSAVIRCISDFQQPPCISKTAGLRAKHNLNLYVIQFCGHCLPSCQAERQSPGLLV